MVYAKIQNGTIVNTVEASSTDAFDPNYQWCDITSYNPLPQIGWTTTDNVNFTNPTPAITLAQAIQQNLLDFQAAVQTMVDAAYTLEIRFNFMAMYQLAVSAGNLPNRVAYITQLFTWAQAVIAYSAAYTASIEALTSVSAVQAATWNFSSIAVPNPNISPLTAIGINN